MWRQLREAQPNLAEGLILFIEKGISEFLPSMDLILMDYLTVLEKIDHPY